jgi:hypothetical protein
MEISKGHHSMIECLIDKTPHESIEALHKYLKKLKIKQADYYTQYLPRKDRHTGEPIPFTTVEKYLSSEFANKNNLKAWIKAGSQESKDWAVNWLAKRREEKGLLYPPLQAELRSLMCPSIPYYEHIGGYHKICESIGYKIRFSGQPPEVVPAMPAAIIEDTREQDPLKLSCEVVHQKLNCGDYGLSAEQDKGIYIERKSLNDFVGTLSDRETKEGDSNFARFIRELERAREVGAYIVMLVENDINDTLGFNYLPQFAMRGPIRFNPKSKKMERQYAGVSPEHIFHNLRELIRMFDNFQPLFVAGRKEAAIAVPTLLALGESAKTFDLELAYETKKLTFQPR